MSKWVNGGRIKVKSRREEDEEKIRAFVRSLAPNRLAPA